jgi:hypothetical protein
LCFISGAANFLNELDIASISNSFLPKDELEPISEVRARILCRILCRQDSTASLNLAGKLLLRGVNEAAFPIFLISEYSENCSDLSWDSFTADHVARLECIILDCAENPEESWALNALQNLCRARRDLADLVKDRASKNIGLTKDILLYCASPDDMTQLFASLAELLKMSDEQRREEPTHLLSRIEFNWAGKEDLFIQLLRLRDIRLATALLGEVVPFDNQSLEKLQIESVEWWLEWMMEKECESWFVLQLGSLLVQYLSDESRGQLVTEFNKTSSKFRRLLLHSALPFFDDLTTEAFSEDAISFILADLNREGSYSGSRGHLLGSIATDSFVTERLLPLLPTAKSPLSENLQAVLRQAGSRHGRRYIVE